MVRMTLAMPQPEKNKKDTALNIEKDLGIRFFIAAAQIFVLSKPTPKSFIEQHFPSCSPYMFVFYGYNRGKGRKNNQL